MPSRRGNFIPIKTLSIRMQVLYWGVGAILILAALQDLFHTLFHPAARGDISDWLAMRVWRACQRGGCKLLRVAGPMAFATVIFYWMASVFLGFALMYRTQLPDGFVYLHGLHPSEFDSFLAACNLSLGSLITLSTGALPKSGWVQLLMNIEAVFGFAILTASISWILSIYPILEHRRTLAHQATLLHYGETSHGRRLCQVSDSDLQTLLFGFGSQVTTARNELSQFPITYFFYERDRQGALAGVLPYLADIAQENAHRSGIAGLAAATLGGAVDDYLKLVTHFFLDEPYRTREAALREYAKDQMRDMVRSPEYQQKAA